MTNRLSHLEKETKAVKARTTLSPQINAGGIAAGFPPSGPGFGIPNFDAPPMMGPSYGSNLGPAFGPSDWDRPQTHARSADASHGYDAPRREPAPVVPSFDTYDAPPPPRPSVAHDDFSYDAHDDYDDAAEAPPFAEEPQDDYYTDRHDEIDDGIIPPDPPEPAQNAGQRAANDFLAAARRAAQAAAEGGARQDPHYANAHPAGFADSSARFTAEDNGDSRRRKLMIGVAASFVLLAVLAGAYVMLRGGSTPTAPAVTYGEGQPSGEEGPAPSVLDETTSQTKNPEASPEGTGASGTASSGTAAPAATSKPAATEEVPDEAIVPAPKKPASKPTATPAGTATLTPAAPAAAAPSTPVETAPVEPAKITLMDAATKGDAAAQYEVGLRYANGEGVTQDMAEAAKWFERAAKQGLTVAEYRLAAQYEKGNGVAQSDANARTWYEKAAKGGNVKAMHNLAVIHAEGRGTAQDFKTAANWFTQAANYGLGDSQYNLAILNERGLGVPKNPVEAYKWLDIAAKGGDKGAAAKRDAIATELSPEDLARAKVASGTWSAKKPEPLANGDVSSLKTWQVSSLEGGAGGPVTRSQIARAQDLLNRLGYDAGSPDGLMGPRTRDAILEYQLSEGLETTGTVTRETLATLEASPN